MAVVPGGRDEAAGVGDRSDADPPPSAVRAVIEVDAAEMARSSAGPSRLAPGALPERRTWVPTPGCRIIACVDVEPIGTEAVTTPARDALWHLAVRRMEHCVRPGDWICMLGGSRFAVCFGNGAHRIPAS